MQSRFLGLLFLFEGAALCCFGAYSLWNAWGNGRVSAAGIGGALVGLASVVVGAWYWRKRR